jgi:DNA invertase Pin-like site-specific DNA recombinase
MLNYNVSLPEGFEPTRRSLPNLTDMERRGAFEQLLSISKDGVLPRSSFAIIARKFHCHARTIKRIWNRGQASMASGSTASNVSAQIRGKPLQNTYYINLQVYQF